jgi:uncharacterized glyoxalase superfamily protein PhnB
MFTGIGSVPVLVKDAKKAAKWYTEKLGFEVSEEGHWVTVKPKESEMLIHLCEKCDDWESDCPGGNTGIYLDSEDKERTYKELKARGVQFKVDLTEAPWAPGGKYAILKDLDGNEFWM